MMLRVWDWIAGAAGVLAVLSGCAGPPSWECTRGSDCARGEFCRAGSCTPAVGFVPGDAGAAGGDSDSAVADAPAARCEEGRPPQPGELALNEILVNVPTGEQGDANGDGVRDAYDDEFVELVNRSDAVLDMTGVVLRNGSTDKFVFGPECLQPTQAVTVFGGGEPVAGEDSLVRVAPSRFAFSNGGGTIVVAGGAGEELTRVDYDGPPAEALTLSPQLDGLDFVPHSTLSAERLLSPGTCPGGQPFRDGCDEDTVDAGGD